MRAAAKIAAEAFFEDPNYVMIFADAKTRLQALEFMFYRNFWILSIRAPEEIWIVKEKDVIAVFIATKHNISRLDAVIGGVLGLVQFGRNVMPLMFEVGYPVQSIIVIN